MNARALWAPWMLMDYGVQPGEVARFRVREFDALVRDHEARLRAEAERDV